MVDVSIKDAGISRRSLYWEGCCLHQHYLSYSPQGNIEKDALSYGLWIGPCLLLVYIDASAVLVAPSWATITLECVDQVVLYPPSGIDGWHPSLDVCVRHSMLFENPSVWVVGYSCIPRRVRSSVLVDMRLDLFLRVLF